MPQPRIELTTVPLYLLEGLGVEVVELWEDHRLVKMKIGIMGSNLARCSVLFYPLSNASITDLTRRGSITEFSEKMDALL